MTTAGAIAGLVWLYLLTVGVVLAVLAVVTFCAYLMVRGNWRARVLSAVTFAGLVSLVLWVVA